MAGVRAESARLLDPLQIIQDAVLARQKLIEATFLQVKSLSKPQMMDYLKKNPDKAELLGMTSYLSLDN
jgi:hypothetical protein